MRVFRDRTDLAANPALWNELVLAMDSSRDFIAVLSPSGAASPWVDREVEYWLQAKGAETMLLVLARGELRWDEHTGAFDRATSTAAPPALATAGALVAEPSYVNLSRTAGSSALSLDDPAFRTAIVDLAAPITGRDKAELDGEDHRSHARLRRLRRWVARV